MINRTCTKQNQSMLDIANDDLKSVNIGSPDCWQVLLANATVFFKSSFIHSLLGLREVV